MTAPVEPQRAPLADLRADALETPAVLKATIAATRRLAELKGTAATIPNQGILIGTLPPSVRVTNWFATPAF